MKHFDRESVLSIAEISEWIEAMELALAAGLKGEVVLPKRMHLDQHGNTYLLMPCITSEYWVTKLVSFCPGNKLLGHPSIYGTVVLCNSKTGAPLAIMDGGALTAMRTAAVSAVGIKRLAPAGWYSLGIVGTGFQGIQQVIFAASLGEIREIRAYDRDKENLNRFVSKIKDKYPAVNIMLASNAGEVAINSQVIITATNSGNPVFDNDKKLFAGKTFVGIGSYKPDAREFPEQLFRQADQVFVDTPDGMGESGDLITPVMNKWLPEDSIHPISSLLSGSVALSGNPTRIFKTVGSAIFDLFAAKLVYEKRII